MSRPYRLKIPGALYHVTSRGDRKATIFRDDTDRAVWLQTLGDACERYQLLVHAFCQMGNHYHILLETLDGDLSPAMRQLNGVYSQYFNRRHQLVGHVFQGRYQAILVDKESYLLEVARYIVLNPVRASLVQLPEQWHWSSYNLTMATDPAPDWLEVQWLLSKFSAQLHDAKRAYRDFVSAGIGGVSPFVNTYRQMLLGTPEFIAQYQRATPAAPNGVSKLQRSAVALPLPSYQQLYADRDTAMAEAYRSHAYTLTEIARHFGVSHATASRAAKKHR